MPEDFDILQLLLTQPMPRDDYYISYFTWDGTKIT